MMSTDEDSGDKIDSLNVEKVAADWENRPWKLRQSRSRELRTLHSNNRKSSLLRPHYRVQHPAEEPHGQDPGLGGEDW